MSFGFIRLGGGGRNSECQVNDNDVNGKELDPSDFQLGGRMGEIVNVRLMTMT